MVANRRTRAVHLGIGLSVAVVLALMIFYTALPAGAAQMCKTTGGFLGQGDCLIVGPWTNLFWAQGGTLTGATASVTYKVPVLAEPIGYSELYQQATVASPTSGTSDSLLKTSWTTSNFVAWKTGTVTYDIIAVSYGNGSVGGTATCGSTGTASTDVTLFTGLRPYDVTTATWVGTVDFQSADYGGFGVSCSSPGSLSNSHSFSSGTLGTTGNFSTNTISNIYSLKHGDTYNIYIWFGIWANATTTGGTGTSATACATFANSGTTTVCTTKGFVAIDYADVS